MNFKTAQTQYGDYRGEVAIDGHQGPFLFQLHELANIPSQYFPIAFSVFASEPIAGSEEVFINIAAVDQEVYGTNMDEIVQNVSEGKIQTKNFRLQMRLDDLFKLMKRINFTAVHKALSRFEIGCEEE